MRRCALPVALALSLTACVAVEGFDPVGDVAAITGSWTIDGQPADGDSCDALGASRVRISFLDGQRAVPHSGLFTACPEGGIDTRMGSLQVVGAGRWTVRLDAIDGDGAIVATGDTAVVEIELPQGEGDAGVPLIEVPAADFFTATLSASFTIGGESPSRASCEAAGIEQVGFVFEPLVGESAIATPQPELCEVGVVGTRLKPGPDPYTVRLVAFGEDGSQISASEPQTIEVATGSAARFDADGPIELGP